MKIALLFGGPSLERGISLNSARSVMDHLQNTNQDQAAAMVPIYFDYKKQAYLTSPNQLYSNTPSDFDFKLDNTAKPLTRTQLKQTLKTVDIAFPAMHGPFGEDGSIQRLLEQYKVPFIGSPAQACKQAFDKFIAAQRLRDNGFYTLPSTLLKIYGTGHKKILQRFFTEFKIKKAVIKPASGGSSIGVFVVDSVAEALEKAELIFSKRMDTRIIVEEYATGQEFTVIILQNKHGLPVALIPTQIETEYLDKQIFDFRKKYLPTNQVRYHCPPMFSEDTSEQIQAMAENIFTLFGMRDFSRFDGWVLENGKICFSDFNPISGMEQNSFLFQQGSRVGFSHSTILQYIIEQALQRSGKKITKKTLGKKHKRKPVHVLFGGETSERQVSLMSGTNVWLKLRNSKMYEPKPFLLAADGAVWELPYALTLNHTVEEILESCTKSLTDQHYTKRLEKRAQNRLELNEHDIEPFFTPRKLSMTEFVNTSPYIFLALHGGDGENGTLQALFEAKHVLFNGSSSKTSRLCIDKYATNQKIDQAHISGISSTRGLSFATHTLMKYSAQQRAEVWHTTCTQLNTTVLIIKPRADGCSSGIVRLANAQEFSEYIDLLKIGVERIPAHTFTYQNSMIEMPITNSNNLLLEPFIETDRIRIKSNQLKYYSKTNCIEVTVGVFEHHGKYTVLSPSITISQDEILSLEEKFQGGTGINLTPPPESIISKTILHTIKRRIGTVAKLIGIKNYCRIDAFVDCTTGAVKIIECNTLPGLTASTVLFHQGLAEPNPLQPRALLERIIKDSGY